MAQALLNHKVGDEVEFEVHGVRHHHRIESIQPYKTSAAESSLRVAADVSRRILLER